jgi:hypothetical protein
MEDTGTFQPFQERQWDKRNSRTGDAQRAEWKRNGSPSIVGLDVSVVDQRPQQKRCENRSGGCGERERKCMHRRKLAAEADEAEANERG